MAARDNNTKYCVEPFAGKNFSLFKRRVEAIFAAKELDKYLETEADIEKSAEVKDARKAYALLLTLLDDTILATLATESTACQIWTSLKQKYLKVSAVSQILVRKKLATLKKRRESSMQQHINELLAVVNELRLTGAEVKDMDIVIYLLMSLPPEYDIIKSTIENQPNETLSLDFVVQRLLNAEELKCERKPDIRATASTDNIAFNADKLDIICHKCKKKGHIAKFCKKKTVCFACGRPGHYRRDCRFKQKSDSQESAAITFMVCEPAENFILDSGTSTHMSSKGEWFQEIKPYSGTISCASKKDILKIEGIGTIPGMLHGRKINLTNVLYVPELNGQLISVKNIQNNGYSVIFKNDVAVIEKNSEKFDFARLNEKGQYVSEFKPVNASTYLTNHNAELWHRRLGHPCNKVLKQMGLPVPELLSNFCEECVKAKHCNTPMSKGPRSREDMPMRMVHSDICGPIDPPTREGEKYFVTIIDDCSRFCEVHLLKHKSDIVDVFKLFMQQNPDLYKIRCDNAKEYVSGELSRYCKKKGVMIDPAPPYSSPLNGVAERSNRYLLEKARALIYEAKLPKSYWGYAIQTAAYLKNRIPNQTIEKVPYELKYGKPPDLNNIKVFGCDAFMRIPDNLRKKLDPKSKKMIFIGYSTMGYRLLDPITNHIIVSRNVQFNEEKKCILVQDSFTIKDENSTIEEVISDTSDNEFKNDEGRTRPKRNVKLPEKLNDYFVYEANVSTLDAVSFEEVETLPKEEQVLWRKAMDDEIESLNKNEVWELVELPKDEKPMSCKWVLRVKRNNVYKARLVARGFQQKPGIDYFETYAPVISMSSLRLMLAIMIQKNLEIYALDIKTAFLNGDLQETIYMEQPVGYNDNSGRVCKLLKSLYGLKQAPRQWFKRFTEFIIHLNFQQLNSEACIFVRRSKEYEIFIVLYVDDLLIAGSNYSEVKIVIQLLQKEFEMSKAEIANEFLGVRLNYTSHKLSLDQKAYVDKVLNKFRMADCKPSDTPLVPKATSSDFVHGEKFNGPYRELIGALLYLSMMTRPDILYSVNCLSQIQEQPTDIAWAGLKRVLRYLKGTSELKLLFCKSDNDSVIISVYVDADWGADTYDRKSISGYIIFFNDCPVIWSVKKQTSIALSSTEAEILSLAKALQDLIVLYNIIKEMLGIDNIDISVYEDNQSAIKLVLNENSCARLKHLDIKLKYVRDVVKMYNINLEYVSTENQLADMFTKCLPKPRLCCLREKCKLMCD